MSEVYGGTDSRIRRFLSSPRFGVVGASADRSKFGNKVLRCYLQHGLPVVPVNPKQTEIEGVACVASVTDLPDDVASLSIITPPAITGRVVGQAVTRGIENVWMQPGAESPAAVARCGSAGVEVIADGTCLLVVLGFLDF